MNYVVTLFMYNSYAPNTCGLVLLKILRNLVHSVLGVPYSLKFFFTENLNKEKGPSSSILIKPLLTLKKKSNVSQD